MPRALPFRHLSGTDHKVVELPIQLVKASPTNPRKDFGALDELAASMHAHGLLQPILVRARARYFELIAGHRRLAAAQQLGWQTILALVRETDIEQVDVLQLVENLQRQDLLPEEEAEGLAGLMRRNHWSTREVAQAIKRSQAYVSKRARVYEDPVLRQAVLDGGLAPSTAEELLPVEAEKRAMLAKLAVQHGWGVTEVREALRSGAGAPPGGRTRGGLSEDRMDRSDRRPRGFTSMVKVMRAVLRRILPEDLTDADRRELRLLFTDLAFLARAKPSKGKIVFPPLPVVPTRR